MMGQRESASRQGAESSADYRHRAAQWIRETAMRSCVSGAVPKQGSMSRYMVEVLSKHAKCLADPGAKSILLPRGGEVGSVNTPIHLTFDQMRPPFQRCVLEFDMRGCSKYLAEVSRRSAIRTQPLATVIAMQHDGIASLLMTCAHLVLRKGQEVWFPSDVVIGFQAGTVIDVDASGGLECRNVMEIQIAQDKKRRYATLYDHLYEVRCVAYMLHMLSVHAVHPRFIATPGCEEEEFERYVLDLSADLGPVRRLQ